MAIYANVAPIYFAYDLTGDRTMMQDEWGATYWDYDAVGRPTRRHDPRGTVLTYGYGQGGHRTELTVEGQGTVYYEYGPTGNMDRLLDGKSGLFTYYEYDAAGRVRLQHHPNATATYFLYDAAGRLSEKVTKKDTDASVLVRFAYTRDGAGNPIAIEREAALGAAASPAVREGIRREALRNGCRVTRLAGDARPRSRLSKKGDGGEGGI